MPRLLIARRLNRAHSHKSATPPRQVTRRQPLESWLYRTPVRSVALGAVIDLKNDEKTFQPRVWDRSRLYRLWYRLLRKVGTADRSLLMTCDISRLVPLASDDVSWRQLPIEDASALTQCNSIFDWNAFHSLDSGRFRCFIIEDGEAILAYLWVGVGDIPPEHNSNGHPWTGLPLYLSEDTAYLFSAYVASNCRGRRYYQKLIGNVATFLSDARITKIVLTTDLQNTVAIAANLRMGFQLIGETGFTSIVGVRNVWYNVASSFLPNQLGRYVGDRSHAKLK